MGTATDYATPFAVGLLEKGVSLETVSILLGHQSLKITQKHYSPWVENEAGSAGQRGFPRTLRLTPGPIRAQ